MSCSIAERMRRHPPILRAKIWSRRHLGLARYAFKSPPTPLWGGWSEQTIAMNLTAPPRD